MARQSLSQERVYEQVCKHPGLSTYDLSKSLQMSGGRVRYALQKLKEQGLIKFEFDKSGSRTKKLTYPIHMFQLLPNNLRNKLKEVVSKLMKSQPM